MSYKTHKACLYYKNASNKLIDQQLQIVKIA